MCDSAIGRVVTFFLFLFLPITFSFDDIVVPPVRIQAFRPRGVRVTMPDVPGLTGFVFNGCINKKCNLREFAQIRGGVMKMKDGKWMFENPLVQLRVGDIIYYDVIVETGHFPGSLIVKSNFKSNLVYVINNLEDRLDPSVDTDPLSTCQPSRTVVYNNVIQICSGQTLLEDYFTSFDSKMWQIEHYIPVNNPEYPFVSYQRNAVTVEDNYLMIEAKLQQDQPGYTNDSIYSGALDLLNGCTAPDCFKQASGADILPPVLSGRIMSKGFAFKYGIMHIRAKMPKGDWLYPEIMLEPMSKKHGSMNYASGVLKIATARGNEYLVSGYKNYGNEVLYAGPIMDFDCREQLMTEYVRDNTTLWGDDFHVYSIRWTPDNIAVLVDGFEYGYWDASKERLRNRFSEKCHKIPHTLVSRMAPFDEFFYITLGLSVGGISEFRDDVKTVGERPKPWRNMGRKAMLNFWRDLGSWHSTWKQPRLIVDYVKVIAL